MSNSWSRYLLSFIAGSALAVVVMSKAVHDMGSGAALLRVGTTNPLFDRINRELGPLPTSIPIGHDGQLYYAIARDPRGSLDTQEALARFDRNGPRYRYRRILFPLLAGGFGWFNAHRTLLGMFGVLIVATGLSAVALADLGMQLKLKPNTVMVALANPGALIALWLLAADPLALALSLVGIALALRRHVAWALVACALSALTKEVYLLVPWALAGWHWHEGRRSTALRFAIAPTLPVLVWSLWIAATLPVGASVANLGMPFGGLAEAFPIWIRHEREPIEIVLATFACVTMCRAVISVVKGRTSVLRWLTAPWIVLGLVATLEVWGKPNNAARAIAILWPLNLLARGQLEDSRGIPTRAA